MEKLVPITNFDKRYKATASGKIWSNYKKDFMSASIDRYGYFHLKLINNLNIEKTVYIHRMIAITFLGEDYIKNTVNHKDGNKLNNNIENLEWMTKKENLEHAFENNLQKKILNMKSFQDVYELYLEGKSIGELAEIFNCYEASIENAIIKFPKWKEDKRLKDEDRAMRDEYKRINGKNYSTPRKRI